MKDLSVYRVTEISESLMSALARLMPQLSPRLGAPAEERVRRMLSHPSTVLFAARAEDRIVGMLTLVWYDAPSGRKAWIEDVVVDAAVRGRGAGEALVRAAQEHAGQLGVSKVLLTSNPSRTAARALYRKCGFNEAETSVFAYKTDNAT